MSSFYVTGILVRLYFKGLYSTTSLPRSSSQQLYLRFEISKIFMLSSIWLHKWRDRSPPMPIRKDASWGTCAQNTLDRDLNLLNPVLWIQSSGSTKWGQDMNAISNKTPPNGMIPLETTNICSSLFHELKASRQESTDNYYSSVSYN